ncbi:hypothetical protein JCM9743_16100 [Natrinema sp. JCM 9743]
MLSNPPENGDSGFAPTGTCIRVDMLLWNMSELHNNPRAGLLTRLPWRIKIGFAVVSLVYAVAVLTDTIQDPVPSTVWAVVWGAVAVAAILRAVRWNGLPFVS